MGIGNTGGSITGRHLEIGSRLAPIDNTPGTIAASANLDLCGGAVLNDDGLIQSEGSLGIDTAGQALSNTRSGSDAGIVARGSLRINAGELNNTDGSISGQQTVAVNSPLACVAHRGQVVALGGARRRCRTGSGQCTRRTGLRRLARRSCRPYRQPAGRHRCDAQYRIVDGGIRQHRRPHRRP